jgi:hypothetical protein
MGHCRCTRHNRNSRHIESLPDSWSSRNSLAQLVRKLALASIATLCVNELTGRERRPILSCGLRRNHDRTQRREELERAHGQVTKIE